jgi:Acyl-CoA reductase (LuxC)
VREPSARGSLEDVLERARASGAALRARSDTHVIDSLRAALDLLGDQSEALGAKVRQVAQPASGLCQSGFELALGTTLRELSREALLGALQRVASLGHSHSPYRLAGFVLSSNVFTAVLRPLAWALLLRVPVVLKPSAADEGLAELVKLALDQVDAEIGAAVQLARFTRHDAAEMRSMAARCDLLHVWGSDETVRQIAGLTPSTTRLVAHGSGLGAAWVPAGSSIEEAAEGLALDVSLYDQRGCLSPQVVWVEAGVDAVALAEALYRELGALARSMPRGSLPISVASEQLTWRSLMAVRGRLWEGEGFAVALDDATQEVLSPGYRNIALYRVRSRGEMLERARRWGARLKALGVAGGPDTRRELEATLHAAPRVSALGTMQQPELVANVDGEAPWTGFL